MTGELDFNVASLATAIASVCLTLPVAIIVIRTKVLDRGTVDMLMLILFALSLAGLVGALGRVIDTDPVADHWIRVTLISIRMFAIFGLLHVLYELWRDHKDKGAGA
jgi:ABC-type Fe3+ transport system permease subunit